MTKQLHGIIGHWVWAMAVILVVAALSITQSDTLSLGNDEPNSLQISGWIADKAFSPSDVLNALYALSPYQGPLYFLLLNQWGYLVGNQIALARLLTIFFALLSLALAYRLGRDAISPIAGNFAVMIMASNSFWAFFVVEARPYLALVLLSTVVTWLYYRIVILERAARLSHYVVLAVACAALVTTHVFGLLLYVVLSLYHLLFVRKGLRWLAVFAAAVSGLILAGPHFFAMYTKGLGFYDAADPGSSAGDIGEILAAWLNVTANGSPLLLILTAAGAALVWRKNSVALRHSVLLFVLLLPAVVVVTVGSAIVDEYSMRYLLAGLPIAVLFQASGLYALYCQRKLLGMLICLWIVAGLSFSNSADLSVYVSNRWASYILPPWHLVSRTAQQSGVPAQVIAFKLPENMMWTTPWGPVGLREHWFDRRDIKFWWVGSIKWLEERFRSYDDSGVSPWVVYQKSLIDDVTIAELETTVDEQGFQACQRVSLPIETEMVQYGWVSLDCMPAQRSVRSHVEPLSYEFFGAKLSADGSKLYFANKWTSRSQDSLDRWKISHQLISENWKNVGQLDLPLEPIGEMRQFAMNVSEAPPGRYRLMAIVYDPSTGNALDWQEDSGGPPSMLFLKEVEIR